MKGKRGKWLWAILVLCVCLTGTVRMAKAAEYPLLESTKEADGGSFVKEWDGWRYRFADGTFLKKSWAKIHGNVFYFDKKGCLVTGWRKYRKSWYYLQKTGRRKGMLVTGWKTIGGKRYYFSKATGARAFGWKKIGKYQYYFNKKGILQKGKMVGDYWLDEKNGRAVKRDMAPPAPVIQTSEGLALDQRSTHIFIGDSRMVGMCMAVTGKYAEGKLVKRVFQGEQELYYAKTNSGYEWYRARVIKKLRKWLALYPDAAVVYSHGINDLGNLEQYIGSYRMLMAEYPQAKFVMMAVNPVDPDKYKGYAQPEQISEFNRKLQEAFPDNYVDTCHYLEANGFDTADGLHYDPATYKQIYGYVVKYL